MRRVARFIPGVAGAVLVCAGLGAALWSLSPLLGVGGSLAVAGGFLLVLDRHLS